MKPGLTEKIQDILSNIQSNYLLLPNSNQFFLEYIPQSEKRVEFISGFTGSNATIIFSSSKFYFFTDSRYLVQAKDQLDHRYKKMLFTVKCYRFD